MIEAARKSWQDSALLLARKIASRPFTEREEEVFAFAFRLGFGNALSWWSNYRRDRH